MLWDSELLARPSAGRHVCEWCPVPDRAPRSQLGVVWRADKMRVTRSTKRDDERVTIHELRDHQETNACTIVSIC